MTTWITALLAALFCLLEPASATTFSLVDIEGRSHQLENYRGKWVLVNIWATWCPPCVAEMPELEALHKSRNDLAVLGVSVDGEPAGKVTDFAGKLNITYPIIVGNLSIAQPFAPKGFPTTILYDGNGQEVLNKTGKITKEEITRLIKQASTVQRR